MSVHDTAPKSNGTSSNRTANGGFAAAAAVASVFPSPSPTTQRLRANPNTEHKPDSYEDLMTQLEYSPLLFSSLERYLPPPLLTSSRDSKLLFMRHVLSRYSPASDRTRMQKHKEYRQLIMSNYKPLHRELYAMHPTSFFVPSFLKAINGNTEQSFKSILTEAAPGVFMFEMLHPGFCEMLISEVDHFERWVHETRFTIMRPNTMNKYGVVLDDFGMEAMLNKLMNDFVSPIAKVLFPEVAELPLDSHHGFVVEYGAERDVDLGFHVDDSEITLNVCLGNQFHGGELFFRGIRCDKHLNTETHLDENFYYSHVPGCAILHRGRHRHGAKATTSGNRFNLILWCRSSVFRELKKYIKDFSSWCGECRREKKERQRILIAATKLELLKRNGMSAS